MQLSEIRDKARLLLGGISTTEYSDANINIAINNYLDTLTVESIMAHVGWEVNGEVATADIVANQREYVFPADLLTIKSIEANLTDGLEENNWTKLSIKDLRTIPVPLSNYEDTDDTMTHAYDVRLFDESLFFIKLPEFDVTNGLKIYYSKEATELSGDTDIPNLPNFLHIGLAYGACLDYSIQTEQQQRIGNFKNLLDEKIEELKEYYAQRAVITKPSIKTKTERYN